MNNDTSREQLVARLLSHDAGLSESQLKEHRVQLERRIERAERMARRLRYAIYVALAAWMASFTALPILRAFGRDMSMFLNVAWLVCLLASPLCLAFFLILYVVRYRPVVVAARSEFQSAILAQLQRQVTDLSARLEKRED